MDLRDRLDIEYAVGGSGNDLLLGNSLVNYLMGGDGDDTLDGGAGTDHYDGGAGNDVFIYYDADYISGGGGTDLWDASAKNTSVALYLDNLDDLENATGGSGDDLLSGNSLNNVLIGGAGNDTLWGAAGNDSLWGDAGNDTLDGGAGNDTLVGGAGNDWLTGGAGIDTYSFTTAGFGQDTISGATDNNQEMIDFSSFQSADATLSLNGGDDLTITIGGDKVTIAGWNLDPGHKPNSFIFADGIKTTNGASWS